MKSLIQYSIMNRILIIEDDQTLRDEISMVLQLEGYQVEETNNGKSGVEVALSFHPDLILCDIMMPVMDGKQVLSEVRSNPSTKLVPLIFITALAEREFIRSGMEQGADDYLVKPFTRDELLKTIRARMTKAADVNRNAEQEMNLLRENILSMVPHEMRTPLHAVMGFSQIIMDEANYLNLNRIADLAGYIYSAGYKLLTLTDRYNKYIEVQASGKEYVSNEVLYSPGSVISDSLTSIADQYDRNSDLRIEVIKDRPIAISEEKFNIVVSEIGDNAFKFSQPGTNVVIKTWEEDSWYILTFKDNGRGMGMKNISKVGAFKQFDRKLHEQQGSGLGLITSKLIIELYDGLFSIQSKPGEGTLVTIKIRFACQAK